MRTLRLAQLDILSVAGRLKGNYETDSHRRNRVDCAGNHRADIARRHVYQTQDAGGCRPREGHKTDAEDRTHTASGGGRGHCRRARAGYRGEPQKPLGSSEAELERSVAATKMPSLRRSREAGPG